MTTPLDEYNEVILSHLSKPDERWSYARYLGALGKLYAAYVGTGFSVDEARLALFLVLEDWKNTKDGSTERFKKPVEALFAITDYDETILDRVLPGFVEVVKKIVTETGDLKAVKEKDKLVVLVDPAPDVASLAAGLDAYTGAVSPITRRLEADTTKDPWEQWFSQQYDAIDWKSVSAAQAGTRQSASALLRGTGLSGCHHLGFSGRTLTFGSSLVAAARPSPDAFFIFKSPTVLASIMAFASKEDHLADTHPAMHAIKAACDSAGKGQPLDAVTFATLGVSALYGPPRWVKVDLGGPPAKSAGHAAVLIEAADTWGTTSGSQVALLTIAHLAGTHAALTQIMTDKKSSATKILAALIDA